jgi:hypothetical protein
MNGEGTSRSNQPGGEELVVDRAAAFDHQPPRATGREVRQDARQAGRVTGIDDGDYIGELFAGLGHGRACGIHDLAGLPGGEEAGGGVEIPAAGERDLDGTFRQPASGAAITARS